MAVAPDATSTGDQYLNNVTTNSGTPFANLTIGAVTNPALVVYTGFSADPGAFIVSTWNGVTLFQIVKINSATSDGTVILWGLAGPATGNKNLVFTWTTSVTDFFCDAVSFSGVDQTGGATTFHNAISAQETTTTGTLTITSAVGEYTVSAITAISDMSAWSGTLIHYDHTSGAVVNVSWQDATGASPNVTHTLTLTGNTTSPGMAGFSIKAAVAAGDTFGGAMQLMMM
jgi:hypothetical protein